MRDLIADDFTVVDRHAAVGRTINRHAHQPSRQALEFNKFVAKPFDGAFDDVNNFGSAFRHSFEEGIKQKKMGETAHPYAL